MSSVSIMEPDGIVNAWTANCRMTRASKIAMKMASPYSRMRDFRLGAAAADNGAGVSRRVCRSFMRLALEDRQERLLRHLDPSHLFHALLPFLLFLQQFALAGDVAAVALGGHVLAHGLDGLAGDDAAADGRLDGHLVELPGNHRPELLRERLALVV